MPRLTRINSIKNLRNFLCFSAASVAIQKNEVIYANNGSGKTNLSRLFTFVQDPSSNLEELKSQEAKKEDRVEFEFQIDDIVISQDNYAQHSNLLNSILVFNRDYIEKNISCDNFSDKKLEGELVIELGESDIAVKEIEGKITKETISIKASYEALGIAFQDTIDRVKNVTYQAREQNIWREFNLENLISSKSFQLNEDHIGHLISDVSRELFNTCVDQRRDLIELESEEKLNYVQPLLERPDFIAICDALHEGILFPEINAEIESNIKFLSHWLHAGALSFNTTSETVIQSGIEISEQKGKCVLCRRSLDESAKRLFQDYKTYFKGEKSKYEQTLKSYKQSLIRLAESLVLLNNNPQEDADRIAELFDHKQRWATVDVSKIIDGLDYLIAAIDLKIEDPSTSIPVEFDGSDIDKVNLTITANTKLVGFINGKMDNTVSQLAKARSNVGKKLLLEFYENNEKLFDSIKASRTIIAQLKRDLLVEQQKLPKKDSRTNISKLFNQFIKDRVGIKKYQSEVMNEQIVIKLNEHNISTRTQLMSEGEQTIIGLCYFLASSIDRLTSFDKFANSIFIIDDPVSSTAYANFFGITTLLKDFGRDIKKELWKSAKGDLKLQTIVLTHNTQFVNLLKKHIWNDENGSSKNHFGILTSDMIIEVPKGKLLSEFQTSMWRIYKKTIKPDYNDNVSNDIRRVAETLRHFYGINDDFNADIFKKIFPYAAATGKNYESLYMTINHFSHGTPEDMDILSTDHIDRAALDLGEVFEHKESPFKDMWDMIKQFENDS